MTGRSTKSDKGPLTSSLPVCIALVSFICPTVVAKTSSTILSKCGERGQPFLDFSRIAFFPLHLR